MIAVRPKLLTHYRTKEHTIRLDYIMFIKMAIENDNALL